MPHPNLVTGQLMRRPTHQPDADAPRGEAPPLLVTTLSDIGLTPRVVPVVIAVKRTRRPKCPDRQDPKVVAGDFLAWRERWLRQHGGRP